MVEIRAFPALVQIYRAVFTPPRICFINGLRISTFALAVNVFLLFLFIFGCLQKNTLGM